jgi:hypothetical protein
VDPTTGKNRTLEEWDNDADFFMFNKCIRGDVGDNVQAAYPRIRSTKIKEAYDDPYKRVNIMNDVWKNQTGKELSVKELFEENEMLMDLSKQPQCVRRKIFETISYEIDNTGQFSHFHFLRFLGKYQLKKVANQLETFIPLLMG